MINWIRYSALLIYCTLLLSSCVGIKSVSEGVGAVYFLPRGEIDIEILKHTAESKYAITVHGEVYIPDNGFSFVTSYQPSAFAHDTVTIGMEIDEATKRPNGFLSKVEFAADDKSDEFIIKLVELVKTVSKFETFNPAGLGFVGDATKFTTVYRGTFDPLSSVDRKRMNVLFDRITGDSFSIQIETSVRRIYEDKVALRSQCIEQKGICFRKPINVPLIFKLRNGKEFKRINVILPDRSSIGTVLIERAAFVKKVTNIEFASGMLKSVHIDKPSQALAAISIPISIANAILAVPGEILKLKIDTTNDNTNLHKARLNELKAKEALVEFKKEQIEKNKKSANENNAPLN